jgi:hypothetical protein
VEQGNIVSDAEVLIDGITHTAPYFVERDVIHAVINGKTYLSPIGPAGAKETVRALLTAMVLEQNRKLKAVRGWKRALREY